MKNLWLIMVLLSEALACSATGGGGRSSGDRAVEYSVILSGSHSQAKVFRVELITGEREWEKTWQIVKGLEEPLPSRPTVDFGRECVIAAFMGERSSSGYRIEVTAIEKKGRTLLVHLKKYETPGMLTVMTSPFTLVRIPRGNYKLKVIEEAVQ
jgi:hypothetical protein